MNEGYVFIKIAYRDDAVPAPMEKIVNRMMSVHGCVMQHLALLKLTAQVKEDLEKYYATLPGMKPETVVRCEEDIHGGGCLKLMRTHKGIAFPHIAYMAYEPVQGLVRYDGTAGDLMRTTVEEAVERREARHG